MKKIAGLISTLALGAAACAAELPPPSIRVTAEAMVSVKPDRAEITFGVVSRGTTAQQASEDAARRLTAALAEARKAAGPKAEITTTGYTLLPVRDEAKGKVIAYNARNMVRILLDDLTRLGPVLDSAVRDGANEVDQVEFGLKDREAVERQALKLASAKARAKADAAAESLGVSIVRVSLLEENGTGEPPRPMFRMAMAASMAAPETPVEPGSIDVRSSVTLTAEIAGRK